MMDWLAKMLKLPDFYLASSGGNGGGIIQGTNPKFFNFTITRDSSITHSIVIVLLLVVSNNSINSILYGIILIVGN